MHRRIANDEVSADSVSLHSRSQKYSVCISNYGIVLDYVARITGRDETNSEIVPLRCVSISNKPVLTDPVAAGAAGQSYASTGIAAVSVADGNIAFEGVIGPAGHENPGEAVGGSGHSGQGAAGAV